MHVQRNIVACSHNRCRYRKATICFFCIVDLHMAFNSIKQLSVAMQTQEWFRFALLSGYELLRSAANIIFLSDFNEIWSFTTNFRKSPRYEISKKICPAKAVLIRADRRRDKATACFPLFTKKSLKIATSCMLSLTTI